MKKINPTPVLGYLRELPEVGAPIRRFAEDEERMHRDYLRLKQEMEAVLQSMDSLRKRAKAAVKGNWTEKEIAESVLRELGEMFGDSLLKKGEISLVFLPEANQVRATLFGSLVTSISNDQSVEIRRRIRNLFHSHGIPTEGKDLNLCDVQVSANEAVRFYSLV